MGSPWALNGPFRWALSGPFLNRTQEAMRVMKRMKLMQEEIQEIDAGAGAG